MKPVSYKAKQKCKKLTSFGDKGEEDDKTGRCESD